MMFNLQNIDRIKDLLRQKQETIAVAESVTAGLLQAAMASTELAMEFFQGGITAYNLGQKSRHLGVDPIQAQRCNCVSDQMAGTMAISASRMCEPGISMAI
jgi:nicotinamide-nucleotide amidase